MTRRLALVLSFAAAAGATLLAADAAGKWRGIIDTPDGPITVVYALAVDGGGVTGTATGPQGEHPIENGKIDGDVVSFTLTLSDGALVMHEGTVSEDQMSMIIRGPWGEVSFNLERMKEE